MNTHMMIKLIGVIILVLREAGSISELSFVFIKRTARQQERMTDRLIKEKRRQGTEEVNNPSFLFVDNRFKLVKRMQKMKPIEKLLAVGKF